MRMRPHIVNQHRQMARQARRELERRKAGRRPMPGSDEALAYLVQANPWAAVDLSGDHTGLHIHFS